MKERPPEVPEEEEAPRNKKTLRERYDIPVEQLDFRYIETCTDARKVEKILKILRTGEEGHFPDLEKCVTKKLEELNPGSRVLRVEIPILRSEYMGTKEVEDLNKTFLEWVDAVEGQDEVDRLTGDGGEGDHHSKEIFQLPDPSIIPIRQVVSSDKKDVSKKEEKPKAKDENEVKEEPGFIRPSNPNRIKSWEYDKWDKFDVDTELSKLEIESLQAQEKELDVKKLKEEQELVNKYMKNLDLEEDHINHRPSSTLKSNKAPADDKDVPDLEDDLTCLSLSEIMTSVSSGNKKPTERLEVPDNGSSSASFNLNVNAGSAATPSVRRPPSMGSRAGPSTSGSLAKSFIEELPADPAPKKAAPKSTTPSSKTNKTKTEEKPKKRFKILIEDLHMG